MAKAEDDGYVGGLYWTPDTDLNQCFLLVDRMRELGYSLEMTWWKGSESWHASFEKFNSEGAYVEGPGEGLADTLPHAVILAAMATEEK